MQLGSLVRRVHSSPFMKIHDMGANGNRAAQKNANGSSGIHWGDFGRRAKDGLSGLPANLGDQMRRNPYRTVALGVVAGVGLGIVLGSRVIRSVLASTVSYAVFELARGYLRDRIARPDGVAVVHAS